MAEESLFVLLWLVSIVAVWFFKEWFDRKQAEINKEYPKHKCSKCGLSHRSPDYTY